MYNSWGRLRCNWGWHYWSDIEKDLVKQRFSYGEVVEIIQKGIRQCRRCREKQKVYRIGVIDFSSITEFRKWNILRREHFEKYIDELPLYEHQ